MEVSLVHFPADEERRERLRHARVPRLLLVAPGVDPPVTEDILEDWVRLPADEKEVRARATAVQLRAKAQPFLDGDGLLHYRGTRTTLSPVEQRILAVLIERWEAVASRERLERGVWPEQRPDRNRLDVNMSRLRGRLAVIGLELRTLRSRGYLLRPLAPPVELVGDVVATSAGTRF